jgi:hypothetical protein
VTERREICGDVLVDSFSGDLCKSASFDL